MDLLNSLVVERMLAGAATRRHTDLARAGRRRARGVVVALVITADGTKVPVGLWPGDTENKTVVTALLADLVAQGRH